MSSVASFAGFGRAVTIIWPQAPAICASETGANRVDSSAIASGVFE